MRLIVVVALLLLLAVLPARSAAWQTTPLSVGPNAALPMVTIARGEATLPADGGPVVWLLQSDPAVDVPGTASAGSLEFVFVRDSVAKMHGEHGAFRNASPPERGTRLGSGQIAPLAATATGPDLTVRVTLIPAATLPETLPPGAIASEPFAVTGPGLLRLELWQGVLVSGRQVTIDADEAPALLLALDNAVQIERPNAEPLTLSRGDITMLTADVSVRNAGARGATFLVTAMVPGANEATQTTRLQATGVEERDAELDEAWRRHGCHLNPGNPSCLIVGLAASCAIDLATPGCDADSDADGCYDVAEVRAGLDPIAAADCVGNGDGAPILNCLFLTGNLACDGTRDTAEAAETPPIDCALLERDPTCDGFAPRMGDGRGGRTVR